MATSPRPVGSRRQRSGFSLLELLVASAVLLIVMAAVFEQLANMQRRSNAEAAKLDLSQQAREFVDQMVHDLHAAGYPNASMYADQPDNTDPRVAAGLVSISPTQIILEGDVNGDGNVYSVNISYVASDPNDPYCPCVRRSAVQKVAGNPLSQPSTNLYTETTHVTPPGNGSGEAGQDLFAFYDQNGTPTTTPAAVKTVGINLSLQGIPQASVPGTSIFVVARLNH